MVPPVWLGLSAIKLEDLKTLKFHTFYKTLVLSIICDKCGSKDETILIGEESIELLKILCLINKMKEYQII